MAGSNPKLEDLFTAKEQTTMKAAWLCLTGAPAVDLQRLTTVGGFNTVKTASNTWGAIKKKLANHAAAQGISFDKGGNASTPKTASTKKRAKKASDEDDDAEDTPAKKRVVKKGSATKIKAEAKSEDEVDDEQYEPEDVI